MVLLAGMLLMGGWMAERMEDAVIHSAAAASALYTDSFIEPAVQSLDADGQLSKSDEAALDHLMSPQKHGSTLVGFRIWRGDTIVYSDQKEMIGRTFPPSPRRQRAWRGQVEAEYKDLDQPEHAPLPSRAPLLEIYAPVRATGTNKVIALAETYQVAETLPAEIQVARIGSWLVVGFVSLLMTAAQLAIVKSGSSTIDEQRRALDSRIAELQVLLDENRTLRVRANQASARVIQMNEGYLRRIGSDLHDGPIQLIGVTALRLGAMAESLEADGHPLPTDVEMDIAVMREALKDSLGELRRLSLGLAAPEIEKLSLPALLELVASQHERRTGTKVRRDFGELPEDLPIALKSCVYRFVQEGLSNATRHADGLDQTVVAHGVADRLEVSVQDQGPGIGALPRPGELGGQGLQGLRDRVESLGGTFRIASKPGAGTCLALQFDLTKASVEKADA